MFYSQTLPLYSMKMLRMKSFDAWIVLWNHVFVKNVVFLEVYRMEGEKGGEFLSGFEKHTCFGLYNPKAEKHDMNYIIWIAIYAK